MCSHSKLDGIRHLGYANEYRTCRLCKGRVYKFNKIKRLIALNRTWSRVFSNAYERAILETISE